MASIQPILNDSGDVIRVEVDSKAYDVERLPSPIPGLPDKILLVDQITKDPWLPSQLGVPDSYLASVESTAKQAVNLSSPSTSTLMTEMYTKAGHDQMSAVTGGLSAAYGMSVDAATSIAKSQGITSSINSKFGEVEKPDVKTTPKTSEFRVKLTSSIHSGDSVVFYVTPNIDESRSASYDQLNPVHHPGAMQVYRSSASRNFNINGKLISRNRKEATLNIRYMNLIRSWVLPYYGTGTQESDPTRLGAPPDVLLLTAYGKMNIYRVPVVMNSYSWSYPDNVDYVPTYDGVPVPAIMDVSVALTETHSPEEFSKFDLIKYKTGTLY